MKRILFVIVITLFNVGVVSTISAQTILDIFYAVPMKASFDSETEVLNYAQKKKLVTERRLVINDEIYTVDIDAKNGHIEVESHVDGQSGYLHFEMCYWNYPNGKLVAFSSTASSRIGSAQINLKFYNYAGGNLSEINWGVFPEYSRSFEVLMVNMVNKFCKKETPQEIKETSLQFNIMFKLPREGKNIRVLISGEEFDENFQKYILPDYKEGGVYEYCWQKDGTFE